MSTTLVFAFSVAFTASVYVLLVTGYVVIYRASKVLNLAHGELMLIGAYTALALAQAGLPPALSALMATILVTGLAGVAVYYLVIRRLAGYPSFTVVLMTISLSVFLQGLVTLLWGPDLQRPLVVMGLQFEPVRIGDRGVASVPQVATIVLASLVYASVLVWLRRSRWGMAMRAAAENTLLAAYRGISLDAVFSMAWGLAAATAGLTGLLYASSLHLTPALSHMALKAFPVALVAGLDSLDGVIPAALLVGLIEQATVTWVSPLLADVVPFLVMLVVLLVRPWGLLGTKEELERV